MCDVLSLITNSEPSYSRLSLMLWTSNCNSGHNVKVKRVIHINLQVTSYQNKLISIIKRHADSINIMFSLNLLNVWQQSRSHMDTDLDTNLFWTSAKGCALSRLAIHYCELDTVLKKDNTNKSKYKTKTRVHTARALGCRRSVKTRKIKNKK